MVILVTVIFICKQLLYSFHRLVRNSSAFNVIDSAKQCEPSLVFSHLILQIF